MFARRALILACVLSTTAMAQSRAPYGPPGYELPDTVSEESLDRIYESIDRENCHTRACYVLRVAIVQITTNANQRKNPGTIWKDRAPDIAYSAIRYREIERLLVPVRNLWPDICRAVVAIAARDAFDSYPAPYEDIAAAALDVSRHLRGPHLDCVNNVLAAMPESKRKQDSLKTVYYYCLDERRGAARCARFRPTDPEFLPYKGP